MTIQEIITLMEEHHNPLPEGRPTCDGVIAGDASRECTGIVFTCCPTAEIIEKTAALGYNFIICHEPTFFSGNDKTEWGDKNSVYLAKRELIERTGVIIYRNHDHLHGDRPDGIFTGVEHLLGWTPYAVTDSFMPGACYQLPPTTVGEIARHLAKTARIDGLRIVGDPDMTVTRVGFTFHFSGGPLDQKLIEFIEEQDMQVIIPGETVDWTIVEYVQDAVTLGKKRALITMGHFNWEEPGMEYMSHWFSKLLGNRVPVTFLQSGNQFRWLNTAE